MSDTQFRLVVSAAFKDLWRRGGGADEVPVLPHQFEDDAEDNTDSVWAVCQRCRHIIPPLDMGDRCPARAGQERGFLQ